MDRTELTNAWIADVVGLPFTWGITDCASLCKHYIETVLDIPMSHEDMSSLRAAKRTYNKTGGLGAILEAMGWDSVLSEGAVEGNILINPLGSRGFPHSGVFIRPLWIVTSNDVEGVVIRHINTLRGAMYAMREHVTQPKE